MQIVSYVVDQKTVLSLLTTLRSTGSIVPRQADQHGETVAIRVAIDVSSAVCEGSRPGSRLTASGGH